MIRLAKRVAAEANAIRTMFKLTNELDTDRFNIGLEPLISLGIGVPHVPSNPVVDLALKEWIDSKLSIKEKITALEVVCSQEPDSTKQAILKKDIQQLVANLVKMDTYQPSQGMEGIREKAAKLINSYYPEVQASARHVCITNGATHSIYLVFQTFVEAGVGVAAFSPFFPPYKKQVEGLGGKWISIPTGENARPNLAIMEEYLRKHPEVSVLVINDPCNPTGVKLTIRELKEMGNILAKPEFSHIVILCDETYHDLVFSQEKALFLHVNNTKEFISRTFVVLSLSKALGGSPGLRVGIVYAPDMKIDDKIEPIGLRMGTLMLDTTCAVSTCVEYAADCVLAAKLGEGKKEWCLLFQNWEKSIFSAYSGSISLATKLFTESSAFPLVVEPQGAFFGFISGSKLVGKKVPEQVTLKDGRVVKNLPSKISSVVFETDVNVAIFLVHAAEVVTVPGSGFIYDPSKGYLRISLALPLETILEAHSRLEYCAQQVFAHN